MPAVASKHGCKLEADHSLNANFATQRIMTSGMKADWMFRHVAHEIYLTMQAVGSKYGCRPGLRRF